MISTVSVICLLLMATLFFTVAVKIVRANKNDRLKHVKNFKKGKFAIIYFVSLPLFLTANFYADAEFWKAVFMSVKSSIELVVLKYDFSSVALLYGDSLIFRIALLTCYALCLVNAMMFTAALCGQSVVTSLRKRKLLKKSHTVLILVGNIETNYIIAKSANCEKAIVGKTDSKAGDKLFCNGITFFGIENGLSAVIDKFGDISEKEINIIINTGDDCDNLIYGSEICDIIDGLNQKYDIGRARRGIRCYVFGSGENESFFQALEERSKGKVRHVNKYKLLARKFAEDYPVTEFMTEEQIDYATGSIKPNVAINVAFIGFGKSNREILNTVVSNNRLITVGDKVCEQKIDYYVFDHSKPVYNRNFNLNFRYAREKESYNEKEFFPLPEIADDIHLKKIDIDDKCFFKNLNFAAAENSFNVYIISLGDDMLNMDMAEKLVRTLPVSGQKSVNHIFVKIKNGELIKAASALIDRTDIHLFGDETKNLYNVKCIFNENIERMAIKRHFGYVMASGASAEEANALWFEKFNQMQRDSNIFACLNIRTKLNLLGFDYAEENSPQPDASDDFEKQYFAGTNLCFCNGEIDYRKTLSADGNIRQNLAVQEHSRWNSYMFSRGYVPASVAEFEKYDKKQLLERFRHINLTTFEGLKAYQKYIMERDKVDAFTADVIKYDYQTLDNAKKFLSECGYKIVRRGNCK